MDLYTTDHSYPRPSDPASGDALAITAVTDDTITVQVLSSTPSTNTTAHRWKPGYVATDAVQSGGGHTHTFVTAATGAVVLPHGLRSQRTLTVDSADYNPTTGIMTVTIEDHHLTPTDEIQIADSSIIFTCAEDSNASDHAYPRPSDPISEMWTPITDVTRNTFKVQVLNTAPSTNTTVHTFKGVISYNVKVRGQSVKIADGGITFTCALDSNGSNHAYPRTDIINHTVTDATYDPTYGDMDVTVAGHSMRTGDYVKFDDDSLTFTCAHDGNATNHTYPRSSDPVSVSG